MLKATVKDANQAVRKGGSRGTVVAVDEHLRTVTVLLDGRREEPGRISVLPAEYLKAGHLAHGYAITGHKAQGMTADRAFVLGDEAMYREWGYVALSRGRAENRLYVVAGELEPTDDSGHGRIPRTPSEDRLLDIVGSALLDSHEQRLALEEFEAVAGPLPRGGPSTPPPPPRDLDDAALRAAAAATEEALVHPEPFPDLAKPNLVDPGRTVAQLSEQLRYLTERRARLEGKMETNRARLEATDGMVARRRNRQERSWLQSDLTIGAGDIADIDRQLPQLETRLERIRNDQAVENGWYRRCADVADGGAPSTTKRVPASTAASRPARPPRPSSGIVFPPRCSARSGVGGPRRWTSSASASGRVPSRPRARHQRGRKGTANLGRRWA